ncbi:TetR/AcrR family transcriptional regulator C-terminal domain-containing protein [Nonomuraea rhodomycinica]|uniref:TetR/AcrR family transcriptional regulator C-terminal domain-containing protein n=1 Tax=Nonomuraea rhodomycinica TaxID=1712872 RepID=A0A7Y6MGK9_9ACTN|nr:TetR/AcrR family transcriptional regulator C-terminal domain-containing protein [Nonomuraea rhodomycinica]NUW45811.1 TetR/AcrR family transcriptional regulator C-terminal domain-containing protein [Nonomuraea rhodomycinica]
MPAPPYLRIVEDVKARVARGELKEGDRVPSTRRLAQDWGVALATAAKALTVLAQEGVVRAEPRVGTLVTSWRPGAGPRAQAGARRLGGGEHELTRERVVAVAVEMADAEGLAAVSMRGVAGRLGASTMSLYRHVRDKDDLVGLMIDAVLGEFPLPEEPPPGWRARLELSARLQWAAYRRHPWLAWVTSLTRPRPSPGLLRHTEWALAAVDGHGLAPDAMMRIHILLYSYVQGIAANLELEQQAQAATGLTDEEWMDRNAPYPALLAQGGYPTFVKVVEDLGGDFELDLDRLFEFGLRPLLDGLALIIERG